MIPVHHRRRVPGGRARPRRLRSLGQADRTRGLHVPTPRRLDAGGHRGAGPSQHHARLPGLGRPDRPAPGGRGRRRASHGSSRRTPSCPRVTARPARRSSNWQSFSQAVAGLRGRSDHQLRERPRISRADVIAAYDAPFPDDSTRPARASSRCSCRPRPTIPASAANRAAWKVLEQWKKPFLTAFSDRTRSPSGGDARAPGAIPGAADQPHTTIVGGGHFLQEDRGPSSPAPLSTSSTPPRRSNETHDQRAARASGTTSAGPRLAGKLRSAKCPRGGTRDDDGDAGNACCHPPSARRVGRRGSFRSASSRSRCGCGRSRLRSA